MNEATRLILASPIKIHDPEPWGKAFSYSFFGHAAVFLLLLLTVKKQQPAKFILTEVNFVEQSAPAMTTPDEGVVASGPSNEADRGKRAGAGTRLTPPRGSGPVAGRQNMKPAPGNISSAEGTEKGEVITNVPMTGPIVALDEFGMVGKKKGALLPFAGRTEGRKGSGGASLPAGNDDVKTPQIVLAKENMNDIRVAESSLGTPLVSERVVADSVESSRMRQLAKGTVGEARKARDEKLKANPFDKDKWGKGKGPFSLEGPLKYRKILKMELPPYPRWAEEKGIEASVSIRVWVDPKGRVLENMYLEKTSGYSELDFLAKSALAKFVFVPLPADQPQEDEWGVATFRFELGNK